MMKHQVADRLFLCGFTLSVSAVALSHNESVTALLVSMNGTVAELGVMALVVLATLALLDTVVNDMLPGRWAFATGERFRQIVWLGMAAAYASHAFAINKASLGFWTSAMYWFCAARCAAVSFIDLHAEFADQRRDRRKADERGAVNA